jgi:hypothetical protein
MFLDPSAPQPHLASPYTTHTHVDQVPVSHQFHNPTFPSHPQHSVPSYQENHTGPFNPDDMELDLDTMASTPLSGGPTPLDTPLSAPLSSYPSPTNYSHSPLSQPPFPPSYASQFPLTAPNCTPQLNSHVIDQTLISAFETTVVRVPSAAQILSLMLPSLYSPLHDQLLPLLSLRFLMHTLGTPTIPVACPEPSRVPQPASQKIQLSKARFAHRACQGPQDSTAETSQPVLTLIASLPRSSFPVSAC